MRVSPAAYLVALALWTTSASGQPSRTEVRTQLPRDWRPYEQEVIVKKGGMVHSQDLIDRGALRIVDGKSTARVGKIVVEDGGTLVLPSNTLVEARSLTIGKGGRIAVGGGNVLLMNIDSISGPGSGGTGVIDLSGEDGEDGSEGDRGTPGAKGKKGRNSSCWPNHSAGAGGGGGSGGQGGEGEGGGPGGNGGYFTLSTITWGPGLSVDVSGGKGGDGGHGGKGGPGGKGGKGGNASCCHEADDGGRGGQGGPGGEGGNGAKGGNGGAIVIIYKVDASQGTSVLVAHGGQGGAGDPGGLGGEAGEGGSGGSPRCDKGKGPSGAPGIVGPNGQSGAQGGNGLAGQVLLQQDL